VLLPATLELLRQQATLYGSQNRDPAHDCLGLCITAATEHHCPVAPLGDRAWDARHRRLQSP
jgi:hypothetical protein